jgi:uncharacterized iron-regulated membrane protein
MMRKSFFWLHLSAGLLASIPLAAMAFTGILLSFESQITDVATRESRQVLTQGGPRLSLDTLVARSAGDRSGKVDAVVSFPDPSRSIELRLGRESVLRVDPWSGQIKSQGASVEAVFGWIERIHRWFGSREIGGKITGVSVLLCLFLAISGLVLWWPRRLAGLRHVGWPNWKLRGKPRDWQWHNSVGFLSLPFLLVLALTGTVMSWKWAENILYAAAGANAPVFKASAPVVKVPTGTATPGVDKKWQPWMDTALAHAPTGWTSVWLSAPRTAGAGPSATFRTNQEPVPSGGSVVLRADGGFESWRAAKTDLETRLRYLVKPLHTGEVFGWVGQLSMALACACLILLAWTGLALAWGRFRAART